jgi:hypothetical protein
MSDAQDLINLEFDYKADRFVGDVFGGAHRVAKIERKSNHWLCVPYGSLSTWDDDKLTRIVIASHKYGIRAEVDNHGMRGVKILLHNRVSRGGFLHKRHPTIGHVVGSDAEKAAIVAELERLEAVWRVRIEEDAKAGTIAAQAFSSGIISGLSLAMQVVQAGGALPPEANEEKK